MHQAPVPHAARRVRRGSPQNPHESYVFASIAESQKPGGAVHAARSTNHEPRRGSRRARPSDLGTRSTVRAVRFIEKRAGGAAHDLLTKKTRHEGGLGGRGGLVHLLPIVYVSGCGVGELGQLHKMFFDSAQGLRVRVWVAVHFQQSQTKPRVGGWVLCVNNISH